MFSDDVLETIFIQEETHRVPLGYQTIMVRAVEKALDTFMDTSEIGKREKEGKNAVSQ
ncbi:MAG: hypothetical protein K6D96_01645 [Acetatifactor sp.]|nr:hypothetical protein [Acetatifactor sp.]